MKVAVGADHDGFEMKQQLAKRLRDEDHEIIDFGNKVYDTNDDYPDFALPLARSMASGDVERGVLVCGSGVGACRKQSIGNPRRALLDHFSARQGVEDDDLNVLCFGGRTMRIAVAWDCTMNFLGPDTAVKTDIAVGWRKSLNCSGR
jgi:ribose 5-phosphate isomerase B